LAYFKDIKGIFFDLDGTLFETAPQLTLAVNRMLVDLKMNTLPEEKISNFIGKGADNLIRKSIKLSSDKDANEFFVDAIDSFHSHYEQIAHNSLPYDGVMETINFLKTKGLKLACITNKPSIFTDKILCESGLNQYLDLILSGDSLEKMKPDPLPIIYSCEFFNIKTKESIMVGDSMNDVEAGSSAGAYVVTVPYGYQSGKKIDSSKVDLAINNFIDIQSIVI
jgi:phosphoglycolate phosphatase